MEIEKLNPAVHVAIGDRLHSNSTIFINGSDVFLVEAMAAREDAERLREYVETELNKSVRFILCTNYFSDHNGRSQRRRDRQRTLLSGTAARNSHCCSAITRPHRVATENGIAGLPSR